MENASTRNWVEQRRLVISSLRGATIIGWSGVEMALREEGPDGQPVFEDPAVPFSQFLRLSALLADGRAASFLTYQNDDRCGLDVRFDAVSERELSGIFRAREVPELALGTVDDVLVRLARHQGDIAEIELVVGGQPLLLVAGEALEDWGEALRFVWGDESVLAFSSPVDAAKLPWFNERAFR